MANTVLGKVSCVPRGDYSASATYTVLDIAGYQGGSYMALKTITGVTPSNDGVNWMQLSGPGLPGEQGEQGEPGAAAGFGQATATVDESTGTPSVDVTTSGPDTAKVFNFAFSGLKGETGAKGDTGDKGDTGATGPQGVSVTDAEIDESGHLIITLSAGEPIDAGNAVGPVGATGETGQTGPQGASVERIERTSGTGAPGTTDTYTVYLTDGSTGGTFNVYNGANGTGSGDFMADGSVPMTGNLQMGGNKITNLGAPGADTDAVRKQDLDAVADEVDKILDGTTPAYIPPATTTKLGGVIVGDGLSVEADGTVSADSQLPTGGTTGQILTKTASGEAWQDAPSGLPDGGTTGQILTQGANGPEWADAPDTGVTTFNGRTGAVTPQAGDYTAVMVGARPDNWMPDADDVGAVPVGRTINGHALSADVTLDAEDVGARPSSWTPSAADVGAIPASQKGASGGVAELDSTGRVPSTQLPSYVDDVTEYTSLSNFPQTGEDGKIYIAEDTNLTYRWSGSQYVEISPSLALGETSSTAYRGDRGKTAYDHSQTTGNPHNTTANEVGALPIGGGTLTGPLTLSGNPTSTNQAASKGYVDSAVSNAAPLTFANVSVTTSMTWRTHPIAALNDAGYTQRVTVPLSGVTVNHSPDVRLSAADMYSGNWASYADTYAGGLYLYAKEAAAITIPLVIFTAD